MGTIAKSTDRVREETFAIGGHCKMSFLDLLGSASYATGGDTLTSKQCGFGASGTIRACTPAITRSGTYLIYPIIPAGGGKDSIKLLWVVKATGAEVANAVNLSAETFTLNPIGTQ